MLARQSSECKKSATAEADLLVTGFRNIELSCKMNVRSVMSFGLEMLPLEQRDKRVQDTLNMQRFRSHFGIGPEAIIDLIIANMKHDKRDTLLSNLMMTLCWLKLYETDMSCQEDEDLVRSFAEILSKSSP